MSSDLALSVGLLAGWLALVLWLVWPEPHCKCCPEGQRARETRDRQDNSEDEGLLHESRSNNGVHCAVPRVRGSGAFEAGVS